MADQRKIYFSGSIRGGREDQALYQGLIGRLRDFGDVLTEHVGDAGLTALGDDGPTDEAIFQRDLQWLREADVLIAEVTTPSLGVGWEIAWAEGEGMPVLCLYRDLPGRRVSAMLTGNPALVLRRYGDSTEAGEHLEEFFS